MINIKSQLRKIINWAYEIYLLTSESDEFESESDPDEELLSLDSSGFGSCFFDDTCFLFSKLDGFSSTVLIG